MKQAGDGVGVVTANEKISVVWAKVASAEEL